MFPYTVDPAHRDGHIGTAGLSSTSVQGGPGPSIEIDFHLAGTVHINNKDVPIEQAGRVTVSSDEWGGFFSGYSRPDNCYVTYQLSDSSPQTRANEVLQLQSPNNVNLVFATDGEKLGMNATVNNDVVKQIAGYALKGIFFAHEQAVGWVFGATGVKAAILAGVGIVQAAKS